MTQGALDLLRLWGKAGGATTQGDADFHPAICHMIDVGTVAAVFLERCAGQTLRAFLLASLGGDSPLARSWLAFLVALHDLGKLSPPFQALRPDLYPAADPKCERARQVRGDHGAAGAVWVAHLLEETLHWTRATAEPIAAAVAGHHGRLQRPQPRDWATGTVAGGTSLWRDARCDAFRILRDVFVGQHPAPRLIEAPPPAWLMLLAGLTTAVDWIGSSERHFRYAGPHVDLKAYPQCSRERAEAALTDFGWLGWRPDGERWSFDELFSMRPRPLQEAMLSQLTALPRAEGPTLLILEAPMGCGKTEAALTVAEHWIQRDDLRGLYYGLPTQATSNQMYERVDALRVRRYPGSQLHLLHAHRLFHENYLRSFQANCVAADATGPTGERIAEANEWFLSRKRGLLANFAVGTIDQALLGALAVRHNFVRLFGLAGKVLILDEVHAYDAYMTRELERLTAWARATSTSVIMLSATLPTRRREQIIDAFRPSCSEQRPAKQQPHPEPAPSDYPLATIVCGSQAPVRFELPADDSRQIRLDEVPRLQADQAPAALLTPLDADGTVAWICNTVGSAQATYRTLRETLAGDWEVHLFHARTPLRQRLCDEKRALDRFRTHRDAPGRKVLVATQVIEQSLDLDFDLMISELCPIDLLLQRAGRLHRHLRANRPPGCQQPLLRWIAPRLDASGVPEWGADQCVYAPYTLLRTWVELQRLPEPYLKVRCDLRRLVDAIYEDEPRCDDLAPALRAALRNAHTAWKKRTAAESARAGYALIPPPDPDCDLWEFDSERPDDDGPRPATRLSSESVRVVCLVAHDGKHFLDLERERPVDLEAPLTREGLKELVLNSVSLNRHCWIAHFSRQKPPSAWTRSPLLRCSWPACFDATGHLSVGVASMRWDPDEGIIYLEQPITGALA